MKIFLASLFLILTFSKVQARVIDRVVAIVNTEAITLKEVRRYRQKLKNKSLLEATLLKTRHAETILKKQRSLLHHLIDEKILDSEIKKIGITVSPKQVANELKKIADRSGISKAQMMASLKQQGVGEKTYKKFLKKSLERSSWIRKEILPLVQISNKQISDYLFSKGSPGFKYKISHILFKSSGPQSAESRAQGVLKKINSNNFSKLVQKYSEEEGASKNGLLGEFRTGEMLPVIEKEISKIKVGQTTKIVQTPAGYHILKLLSKKASRFSKEDKSKAYSVLYQKTLASQIKSWIKTKRSSAFIKIN